MTAIQIIAASAKNAGIQLTPAFPDYNGLVDERNSGKFDLVINNDKQLGPTPYTYYDYLFHLPIADSQTFANFSRFTGAGATPWALTLDLNKVHPANVKKAKQIHSKIQRFILEDLPAIPLWYNGMWAQYNTTYWTNFPTATGKGLQNTPERLERLPQHDGHRRARQAEAARPLARRRLSASPEPGSTLEKGRSPAPVLYDTTCRARRPETT